VSFVRVFLVIYRMQAVGKRRCRSLATWSRRASEVNGRGRGMPCGMSPPLKVAVQPWSVRVRLIRIIAVPFRSGYSRGGTLLGFTLQRLAPPHER
jgi:hypothetical protein